MPFENSQAAAAPTRRSSRPRTEPFEAIAAEATDAVFDDAREVSEAPLSRRAARQRLTTAEIFVAASAVAAASAVSDPQAMVPVEPTAAGPEAPASADDRLADDALPAEENATAHAADVDTDAPDADTDAPDTDAFESAARAFRAGASESTMPAEPEPAAEVETETVAPAHVARRRPPVRKFLAAGATIGVMSIAGLLAVGMTLPAEAVAAVQGSQALSSTSLVAASSSAVKATDDDEIQAFVTSSDVQNDSLARSDSFSTVSLIQVASEEGINYSNEVFTNDAEAAIQWPFKVGVGMSSGYGMRWGRLHEGIDFVPGEGAPIQAIADGTVRIATEQGGAYGVTVYIDHVIDGQVITSHYSHMQYGSLEVKAGQTVKVGDIVGHTGNTGRSYGAHLHFEIITNGSTIDPLPWLRENAGRTSY
ncbi:peptidoglycan DD-metalloendopeptidase family protein [Microbacterium sp. 3J1]|uniref:peptidoglycan DD-metalloendopeptidase family protein n=1 Tax=Microbacterium sp. 3J1 TaxID=861269 RepID=UPI000AD6F45B|nr:peptidoglycan DD-metalloendopeptidase family protein [Microbacterium sp. 3J1]